MNVLDIRLNANAKQTFSFNPQWNSMIFVLSGSIEIDGQRFDQCKRFISIRLRLK